MFVAYNFPWNTIWERITDGSFFAIQMKVLTLRALRDYVHSLKPSYCVIQNIKRRIMMKQEYSFVQKQYTSLWISTPVINLELTVELTQPNNVIVPSSTTPNSLQWQKGMSLRAKRHNLVNTNVKLSCSIAHKCTFFGSHSFILCISTRYIRLPNLRCSKVNIVLPTWGEIIPLFFN